MTTAAESFSTGIEKANIHLNEIKEALLKFENNFKSDEKNWGYVGSLNHTNELLEEIVNFLK